MENSQSCQSVFVTAAVSAAVIGRLCATVFIGLQRINTFDTAKMAGKCSRQLLEHLFSIATLAVLLSTDEAPLTRALICIMSIDHHLCYFGFLVQKYSQWRSDKSIKRLKVIQCFLTMSCRGAVPLVSLIVSVSFFDADMLAMKLQSVIVFAACAFVYLFYNSWLIVTSTREVWFLYSRRTNDEVDKPTWVNRRANNELFPESKISPLQYLKNEFKPSKGDFHTKCNANKRFQQIRQFSSSSKRIPIKRIKGACNCRSASLSASEYQIPALAQPTTHNIAQLKPPTFRQSVLADLKDVEISNGTKRINGHLAKKSNHILDTIREETENLPVISTRK
ncbi:hypothetical protein LSH36_517g02018 [Paralvinella palmiformis]|uniref:Uncharacterized protein n=1 Tax=Paralvinella palmiformis TaxID=53620 RepID=A0AAD9J8C1_9ANNE|nr:hypothetical protein LSH36_517g02018 [Paralvinella palmiformis]